MPSGDAPEKKEDDIWNDCPEGERKPSARAPGVSLPAQSTVVAQEGPPKKPEGRRSVTGTWVADVSPERSSGAGVAGIASSSQPFAQTGGGRSKKQGIPENHSKSAAGIRPATRGGQENKSPPSPRGAQSERASRQLSRGTGRFINVGHHERAARRKKAQQHNGYARFLEGQWVVQQAGKQPEADWRNWVSRGAVPEEPSAPSMRYHSAPGGRRPEPDAAGRARRMAGCSLNRIPTQLAAAVRVGDVSPAWTKADKSATFKEKLPKVYKPQPPPRPGPSKEGSREQSQMISGSKRVPRSVAAAQAAALCVVQNPPLQPQVPARCPRNAADCKTTTLPERGGKRAYTSGLAHSASPS
ncbi:hypothetical protein CYMTET_19673 [Cymbomonas tetramitiformis]|uniref:Uncharacterized protein n=1 Tax=Cymbomonas tetramitiformis TaxID=36881 RepID=A0AAE0G5M3_9CHLO|nr:hypothetical protein CYMTET_19673 [Cymbomonas tetramitiformis]